MTPPPFQRFLDEQRDGVWRFLVAAVGRDAADDCFQETFLAALRGYPKLRDSSNLRAWVMTIADRKAIDHHRSRKRAAIPVGDPPEPREHQQPHEPGDDETWTRVRGLPPRQRSVLLLRYAGDMTHAEVAAALGCSEEASRQAAREGLDRLRKETSR
jgi:RNA polymerase sigma factor (sigma-70 family)